MSSFTPKRRRILTSVLVLAIGSAIAVQLSAQETTEQRLSTPHKAIANFLDWQNDPNVDLTIAAESMGINPSLSLVVRRERARMLKAVLDARGLLVQVDEIPDDPDYVDDAGEARYLLFPALLPEVFLVKVGSRWMFSSETVVATPRLYDATFSGAALFLIPNLPDLFQSEFLGIALWQYTGIFFVLLFGLLLRKVAEFFLNRLARWLIKHTPPLWDEKIVFQTVKPVSFLIMTAVFYLVYADLQLPVQLNLGIKLVLELMFSGSIIWLAFKLVDFTCDYVSRWTEKTESKLDDQLVPMLRKTLKVFAFVLGVIAVVQNYGYSVSSILAGLGIGGLAVALAAKDTLANLFGSITIFADKPFQIGDWIITEGVEGTVEEVGFRSTRIRTFYNSLITVPNSKIANSGIDNMGMRQYRRIRQVLGLTYSTSAEQMHAFVEGVRAAISANRYMRKDFYEVHFNGFGSSSLDVLVYCFLDVESWTEELREKHNFFLEILRIAEEVGVEFAFPTQTLHVDSFYGREPRPVGKDLSETELAEAVTAFGPRGRLSRPDGPELRHQGAAVSFAASTSPTRGS